MRLRERDDVAACRTPEELMRLLGRSLHLEVLTVLACSPGVDVSTIAAKLELDPARVSAVLRSLSNRNLLRMHREERRHLYSLSRDITVCADRNVVCLTAMAGDAGSITIRLTVSDRIEPAKRSINCVAAR